MKSFRTHMFYLGSADIISRLLGFCAVTYLARILGASNIGVFAVGMSILAYASILINMGLPILGVRSVATKKDTIPNLLKRICFARFFLSIVAFIIGIGMLIILVEEYNIKKIAIIYLISMFPSALLLEWLFQGLNKMKLLSIGRIIGISAYLFIIIGKVSNSEDIYWVPFAWCFGCLIQAIYLWFNYKKLQIPNDAKKQPLQLFKLIKQGLPLGISELISQSIIQFPFIYLGFFDTTKNVGLYSVAFRVVVLLLIIDRVFYNIFFPAVSRSFKDSKKHLKEGVIWTIKIVTTGSLYVAIFAIIAGKDLFNVIFGPEFRDSVLIFQILLGYFVLTIINSIFTFTLIGIEKEKLYTKSLLIGTIVFFVIIFLPLPFSATLIAPIALCAFQFVSMLVMMKHLKQLLTLNPFIRVFFSVSVAFVFSVCVGPLKSQYPLIVPIFAAVLALPTIAFASGINRADIKTLKVLLK